MRMEARGHGERACQPAQVDSPLDGRSRPTQAGRRISPAAAAGQPARPDPARPFPDRPQIGPASTRPRPSPARRRRPGVARLRCRPAGGRASRIAVLVHGLTGSHASPQVRRLAAALLAARRARGAARPARRRPRAAAGPRLLPRRLLRRRARRPGTRSIAGARRRRWPWWASRSAATSRSSWPARPPTSRCPAWSASAAIAPPIDLDALRRPLAQARNRFYENFFLRDLMAQAEQRQQLLPRPAAAALARGA